MNTNEDGSRGEADPTHPDSVAVYWLYNEAWALPYVGITHNPKARFAQHAADKLWWWEVATWDIQWFEDRVLAVEREARSITLDWPAYNVAGTADRESSGEDYVREWTENFTRLRPETFDLNYMFFNLHRTISLGPDTSRRCTPEQVERLYRFMLTRAKAREIAKHEADQNTWFRSRIDVCLARDARRRQEVAAAAEVAAVRAQGGPIQERKEARARALARRRGVSA